MRNEQNLINSLSERIKNNCSKYAGCIPNAVANREGCYECQTGGHWTDGFWPGLLLLANVCKKEDFYMQEFEKYVPFLEERVANDPVVNARNGYLGLDHDVGFIFHLTAVFHFRLTGSSVSGKIGLRAADALAARFQERGAFIRAWNDWEHDTPEFRELKKGKAIIDSLMNLPLLYWASRHTGEARYAEFASRHANTLMRNIVRKDGSTYHTFQFDPATGDPKGGKTAQGYADDSCWSRGQAWALYGFALDYRHSSDEKMLATALRCAEYWKRSLLPDGDAPWDFAAPRTERLPIDTSAMAIAACGLLELFNWLPERSDLLQLARATVSRLIDAHLAPDSLEPNAFLLHGCVGPSYFKGSREEATGEYGYGTDQPLIYGDYFFYEALLRLSNSSVELPWF
ncbi:glycoside hydrolase family 88 protein [Paenibacillus sp. NPDC056579]|uniref:glycoside hydrolase family 88 protein n=1 Tax=Paenibacillus sp. NPDC056579 TaxID=3345871 RepID=UPI0036CBABAE